jgi:hypothetical protein
VSGPDVAPAPAAGERWEDGAAAPALAAFAAHLIRRRAHDGLGPRCERLRSRGEAIDRFAAGRELASTLAGRVGPRWETGAREVPEPVTKGLRRCQKPFHLWNVERVEHDDPLTFERVSGLIVGRAAALPEELRPPRTLKKASRALREWIDEQAFHVVMQKMDKKRHAKLLRDKLPYGRKDDDPGDSIVIQVGESLDRIAAFVRRPEGLPPRPAREADDDDDDRPRLGPPPSFDLSQPDADDDGGGGGPFGGLDLSQPDGDDDDDGDGDDGDGGGGGPFGGLDLSQPDDDDGDDDSGGGGPFGGLDLSQPDDEG